MSRQSSAIPEPSAQAVARVPDADLGGERLARACWTSFAHPWWFANRERAVAANLEPGRFDLAGDHGSCYFADDPVGALIEKVTDPAEEQPAVSTTTLANLQVWQGPVAGTARIADTTDRRSRIPKELGATHRYEPTWAWADALHADGRSGLRWWLRLDPGPGRGVAIFGPASHARSLPDPSTWPDSDERAPALDWRDELAEAIDIIVDDPPSLAELEPAPFD